MDRSILRYFTSLVFLGLIIACEKEIGFRPKDQHPFLVMNSYLCPDSAWNVSVSQSVSIMENLTENVVSDCEVKVYENETLVETLQFDAATKRYFGTGKPAAGKKYKITVAKNGFLPIEATSAIEPVIEILQCSIVKDTLNERRANATITFKDPAGVKNFYRLVVANVDEFAEKPSWAANNNSQSEPWLYTNYSVGIGTNDPNLDWGNESSSAGFIDDVPNNIFDIFSDDLIEGKEYTLSFSYLLSSYPEADNKTIIYLQSITEDLHKYLKTLSAQFYFGDDLLMEPIQVYSNVKNGGGILGSYNSDRKIINVDNLVIKQE